MPLPKILAEDLQKHLSSDTLALTARILDIDRRISESREIDALLHGFDGGYSLWTFGADYAWT